MSGPAPSDPRPSVMRRWLREPLLHFLLGGVVVFVLYDAVSPKTGDRYQSNQIQLTENQIRQMAAVWAAQWQRPPTQEEMNELVEDRVREEVFYREALAIGLDRGDTIVRRRLAQKMEFLGEDTSAIRDPDTEELRTWFARNQEQFAQPARITFRHIYFSPDQRGRGARDAAAGVLNLIADQPQDAAAAADAGDRFMYREYYADRIPEQVASVFGGGFAQALFQLEPGMWQGPVESGLGWHLVFVVSIVPGRVPDFEEIEPDVKAAWINERRAEAKRRMYAAMRARYEVLLPAAPAGNPQ